MDFSAIDKFKVFSETKFRTPLRIEKQIGLWVDRIGENPVKKYQPAHELRKLGQYAVVLIEDGSGFFISPSTGQIELNKGNVAVLFPDEPNIYYPAQSWHEKYIVWNGPDAVNYEKLGYLSKRKIIIKDNIGIVSEAFERLKKIISNEDKAAILERKNIITDMILELFRLSNSKDKEDEWHLKIMAAVSWLTENYADEISIADLSKKYFISESLFRRYFKLYTGRSPREFINSIRISRAKGLLKKGSTIKEVSSSVGYKDMFYFMRLFKKATGISCGNFRME